MEYNTPRSEKECETKDLRINEIDWVPIKPSGAKPGQKEMNKHAVKTTMLQNFVTRDITNK